MDYTREIALRFAAAYNRDSSRKLYSISTKVLYPEYYTGEKDGVPVLDIEEFQKFVCSIERDVDSGLFSAVKDKKTGVYKTIKATIDQICILAKLQNLTLLPKYVARMRDILTAHQPSTCPQVTEWISQQLQDENLAGVRAWFKYDAENDTSAAEKGLSVLLNVCEAVYAQQDDIMLRNFSSNILVTSKDFEGTIMKHVCAIMSPDQFADKVDPYEILKELHILRNPASVWVRGHGRILFQNGDVMTLSSYSTPFAMTRSLVESIVTVETKALLTIENLTTFNDYEPSREDLVVYTSGYANSLVVRFLQIVLRDCRLQYTRHFGDSDAYGFDILRNLSDRVGNRFAAYHMDVETYWKNAEQAIPMTDSNKQLFPKLMVDPFFTEDEKLMFSLLMERGKTLEQEGIQNNS